MSPEIKARNILINIRITDALISRWAILEIPNLSLTNILAIKLRKYVTRTPKLPDIKPIIRVSALKTLLMSFLLAPIVILTLFQYLKYS